MQAGKAGQPLQIGNMGIGYRLSPQIEGVNCFQIFQRQKMLITKIIDLLKVRHFQTSIILSHFQHQCSHRTELFNRLFLGGRTLGLLLRHNGNGGQADQKCQGNECTEHEQRLRGLDCLQGLNQRRAASGIQGYFRPAPFQAVCGLPRSLRARKAFRLHTRCRSSHDNLPPSRFPACACSLCASRYLLCRNRATWH